MTTHIAFTLNCNLLDFLASIILSFFHARLVRPPVNQAPWVGLVIHWFRKEKTHLWAM